MEEYDKNFYNNQKDGSVNSAREILPYVMDLLNPKSVIDIGCGVGAWLSVFEELGVNDYIGLDGNWVNRNEMYIDKSKFISTDLKKPIKINRKFDLAVSLEVAEHLPKDFSEDFIDYITDKSDYVLFSGAIPNQGGVNHINEQWPEFWIDIFLKKGYYPIDFIRWRVWDNKNIEVWYKQNILLFVKKDDFENISNKVQYISPPFSVIHPQLYTIKLKRFKNSLDKLQKSLDVYKEYNDYLKDNYYKLLDENTHLKENLDKQIKKLEDESKSWRDKKSDYINKIDYQRKKIDKMENEISHQRKKIDKMEKSKSWKFTKPLRILLGILRRR